MVASIQYPAYVEPLAPSVEGAPSLSWQQPQQPPVAHRRFRPPSGAISGVEPTLLEAATRTEWQQPQQRPVSHRKFVPPSGAPTAGAVEGDFAAAETVTLDKWFRPQQSPVPHRPFRPASGAASGAEPSLLEEASRLDWRQPQQAPVPHRRFRPPDGVPVAGQDEDDFAGAETVTLDKWWRPQQPPVAHRQFRPASGTASGIDPSLLEGVTLLDWRQPQQGPVAHRAFRPPSWQSVYPGEPTTFVEPEPEAGPTPEPPPASTATPVITRRLIVDEDTLRAVRSLWLAEAGSAATRLSETARAALARLPALFDRPIAAGRLKADRDRARPLPYAQLACELKSRELVGTKGSADGKLRYWHDRRLVTITLWGLKQQVTDAASDVLEVFNLDAELVYPSGAKFMQWLTDGECRLTQDETTREGQDVWKGVMEATVWSIRVI